MTQFLCLAALVLLSLMQLTQAVATLNNNNNNNNNIKPKAVVQVQPGNPSGNKPAVATTTIKPQRLVPGMFIYELIEELLWLKLVPLLNPLICRSQMPAALGRWSMPHEPRKVLLQQGYKSLRDLQVRRMSRQ